MTISKKINKLRKKMAEQNIDIYLIPSSDFHQSEYVGDYFKAREFISGFTGSAGTVAITQTQAGLWTDGRYFIQAEAELANTEIKLYKMGYPNAMSLDTFLVSILPQNGTLAFDGRVLSSAEGLHFETLLADKNIRFVYEYDFIDSIWENRPKLPIEPVYSLSESYTGESTASKLMRVRDAFHTKGATTHLLSSLDDIAWLLNLRGSDVAYTPVFLCYLYLTLDSAHLFIDNNKISDTIYNLLKQNNIELHDYDEVYEFIQYNTKDQCVFIDPSKTNYKLYRILSDSTRIVESMNPSTLFKAQKNEIEIQNIKNAHLKDAIAHTKFLYWLKSNYNKQPITEMKASDKLEQLRAEQEHYLGPSFSPISAFAQHAAMCHYTSSEETNTLLIEGNLYLIDSGGHYLEGSTDITRTIALGSIDASLKIDYTNVLKGNLALARANFLYGCSGENLDILARQYLWNANLDYMHGTGHGIGNLLTIHEGPCNIKWRYRQEPISLESGMILSDEPGLYIEHSHGIRLENELLVREGVRNEYGQFMHFEVLTYVPFDLDAIDASLLSFEEKVQLNQYHKMVYELVSPYLSKEENDWLTTYTKEI